MDFVHIGQIKVSRFILGSNPFSGFSHQSPDVDMLMKRYYTVARIKETLFEAESLGINTLIARTDYHIMRLLLEYWDEGGTLQWFAQTCPEVGDHEACINRAASMGAKACHIHGGVMDSLLAQERLDEIPAAIDMIRQKGMLAGIAGHNPEVFKWAEDNLDVDYTMCSYYNSAHRDKNAEHVSGTTEWFLEQDRRLMTSLIQTLSRPAIHYKVLAAGRNRPAEAFACVAENMRAGDAVCVGVFTKDAPHMLSEDVELFGKSVTNRGY
jgi:hypothetical protein